MTRRIWLYLASIIFAFIVLGGMGGTASAVAPNHNLVLSVSNGAGWAGAPAAATPTPISTHAWEATRTPTYNSRVTPIPFPCSRYIIIPSFRATIVPGEYDTGNHCNNCRTTITIPFRYSLYRMYEKGEKEPYLPFLVGESASLRTTSDSPDGHGYITMDGFADGFLRCNSMSLPPNPDSNQCLPAPSYDYSIFGHWDDLDTSCATCGIFTSVSGSPPNQIFNIEWRAYTVSDNKYVNFEIRLYENPAPYLEMFDIIYGAMNTDGNSATVGVQGEHAMTQFTQYSCNTPSIFPGLKLTFALVGLGLEPGLDAECGPIPRPYITPVPIATEGPGSR